MGAIKMIRYVNSEGELIIESDGDLYDCWATISIDELIQLYNDRGYFVIIAKRDTNESKES